MVMVGFGGGGGWGWGGDGGGGGSDGGSDGGVWGWMVVMIVGVFFFVPNTYLPRMKPWLLSPHTTRFRWCRSWVL